MMKKWVIYIGILVALSLVKGMGVGQSGMSHWILETARLVVFVVGLLDIVATAQLRREKRTGRQAGAHGGGGAQPGDAGARGVHEDVAEAELRARAGAAGTGGGAMTRDEGAAAAAEREQVEAVSRMMRQQLFEAAASAASQALREGATPTVVKFCEADAALAVAAMAGADAVISLWPRVMDGPAPSEDERVETAKRLLERLRGALTQGYEGEAEILGLSALFPWPGTPGTA